MTDVTDGRHATGLPVTTAVTDRTDGDLPGCRLRRVTAYIDENLQRQLRLAELSAVVHMSPYHFARLFKRSTSVSPHRFVVRRRIDEAQALLATQTVAIAEIARSVGFRTPSHFTTTFRRITGMTPTEYRSAGSTPVLDRAGVGMERQTSAMQLFHGRAVRDRDQSASGQPLLECPQAAGAACRTESRAAPGTIPGSPPK
jgi:AraC-like DNA-binding protein